MIVTIDGPAGSGKSTSSRGLAAKLGFDFLDTGAMYRAVALYCARRHIALDNIADVERAIHGIHVDIAPGQVFLNGENVEPYIRTREMASGSSRVAKIHGVRESMVARQREIAKGRNFVTEGRDLGTVVFPDAPCKFYMVANVFARARRRFLDLQGHGETDSYEQVLADQIERDDRDEKRIEAPLKPAEDAIVIDTSNLSREEVVACMAAVVEMRCPRG